MCIVAVADRASVRYPFIVAANRDERHARPSEAAGWWHGEGSVLAGRDLEAGGTWLGVTGAGRFAAVTNIFEGRRDAAPLSRGALVAGFLESTAAPSDYVAAVEQDGARYGPFNLILRSEDGLQFVSNRNSSVALEPGIHVFSNNAPGLKWAKTDLLADAIRRAADRDDPEQQLIATLTGTDARGPLERAAESLFVIGNDFGTRCTTVLIIDDAGRARFVEQRFGPDGDSTGRSEYQFEIMS